MARPKGWRKESARHALAAKGVKTGRLREQPLYAFKGKFEPSLIQYPTGKYGFVGTVPEELVDRVFDTKEDAIKAEKALTPFKHIPTLEHFPEAIPVIRDHDDNKKEAERKAIEISKETGRMAYIVWRSKGTRPGYIILDPVPWADDQ